MNSSHPISKSALALLCLLPLACGSGSSAPLVSVSGNAFDFGPEGGRVADAQVTILEIPGLSTTTDSDGFFQFDQLPARQEVTFVMSHDDFAPARTGTFYLPDEGLEKVTFQVPEHDMFDFLATLSGIDPDPAMCQIATTVTRKGGTLYGSGGSHGEAGATVDSGPPISSQLGPVYFGLYDSGLIYPDRGLSETSDDGGVLYLNVPPGVYKLYAHKPDTTFNSVKLKCDPGILVNASPPWGPTVQ